MRRDEHAASPLVVLSTFVAVAVVVTALVLLIFFNEPEPDIGLVFHEDVPALEVTDAQGGLQWDALTLRLVDRGGFDQSHLLEAPLEGPVQVGDRITFQRTPPAGGYLFSVLDDGEEMARLVLSF